MQPVGAGAAQQCVLAGATKEGGVTADSRKAVVASTRAERRGGASADEGVASIERGSGEEGVGA